MAVPGIIRSCLFLIIQIPSILCSIFILYHLLMDQALRTALHNHVIIAILFFGLILEITDVSSYIHYYRTYSPLVTTPAFCLAWTFIGSWGIIVVTNLVAWASIERHTLIFNRNRIRTKTKRFLLHYLPLIICIMSPTLFYFTMFFIVPCHITPDYTRKQCGYYFCVYGNPSVGLYDSVVNYIIPPFIIVIFNVALIIRVLASKHRTRQRIRWRNYRKLAIQLLSISILYFFLYVPPLSLYAVYSAGLPRNIASDYYGDSLYFAYYAILLTPFVCAVSLPELRAECKHFFLFWRRRRAVGPEIFIMTGVKVDPTAAITPAVQ